MLPHLLRVSAAADFVGLPESTFRKTLRAEPPGTLPPGPPALRVGRTLYFRPDDLRAWVNTLAAKTEA